MKANKSQHKLLRGIARIMYYYPAHKLTDVLEMESNTFSELLKESYNIQKEEVSNMIKASSFPHLDKSGQKEVLDELRLDILPDYAYETDNDKAFEQIKSILGKNNG